MRHLADRKKVIAAGAFLLLGLASLSSPAQQNPSTNTPENFRSNGPREHSPEDRDPRSGPTTGLSGADAPGALGKRDEISPQVAYQRVVAKIDWPSKKSVAAETLNSMPQESREAVATSPVPVLVPADRNLAEVSRVIAGDVWYAASTRGEGFTAVINATNVSVIYPGETLSRKSVNPPTGMVRGQPAYIFQSEGVWEFSWAEFGASYTLRITCDDDSSTQCADSKLGRDLTESLVFVGGDRDITE